MQHFKQKDIQKIESELGMVGKRYSDLSSQLLKLSRNLKQEKAKEYLFHGVMRRLRVIYRCINNIFTIFPIERETLLNQDELDDVMINLHAFFVNVSGILDNLAWVFIHEKQLANTIDPMQVGLFKKKTKDKFSSEFLQYLDSVQIKTWHNGYLKNYRDALSHRIPLYVLPKTLNSDQRNQLDMIEKKISDSFKSGDIDAIDRLHSEEDRVGGVCPYFIHSLSESENKYFALHVQVITDFKTVEEIVGTFMTRSS